MQTCVCVCVPRTLRTSAHPVRGKGHSGLPGVKVRFVKHTRTSLGLALSDVVGLWVGAVFGCNGASKEGDGEGLGTSLVFRCTYFLFARPFLWGHMLKGHSFFHRG